ncbi:MAG: homoserine dehydrogenase [Lactobacillus equicursoris]|uniref:homoserine dehydrogenase n=1 Tax=Lactobacillus equicursoris TaxID=420645 RepID=UPI00242E354B|nr:homoserine dehydrogenase [Lactobacillus equicursoris]MDD6406799.1 homoserine dehydrogenase [Lactobacillus equicursoris]
MEIAVLGWGVVGGGVIKLIDEAKTPLLKQLHVKRVLIHRPEKAVDDRCTTDINEILNDPEIAIVCECIGGLEPAHEYAKKALEKGKHVVTANKKMLATFASELFDLARQKDLTIGYEACVGGGIPWIANLERIKRLEPVEAFQGILNGTSNYILSQMEQKGAGFAECLKKAQELGYAESDPSDDIDGHDVCYKVVLSALTAFGQAVDPKEVPTFGIRHLTKEDFAFAKGQGRTIKLIGQGRKTAEGVSLQVLPVMVKADSLLGSVSLNFNAGKTWSKSLGPAAFVGQGAGSLPTAHAAVQDLLDILEANSPVAAFEPAENQAGDKQTFYVRSQKISVFASATQEKVSDDAIVTKPLTIDEIGQLLKAAKDEELFLAGIEND